MIGVVFFVALVAIMQIGLVPARLKAVVGEPISQTVLAPRDIQDPYETNLMQEEAGHRALIEAEQDSTNWYIAQESGVRAESRLESFKSDLDNARSSLSGGGNRKSIIDGLRNKWDGVSTEAWDGLLDATPEEYKAWEDSLDRLLVAIEEGKRISDMDLRTFLDGLPEVLRELGGDANDRVLIGALRGLIMPNLVLDQDKVSKLVDQAKQTVAPIYYRSGQPILAKGEVVTKEKLELLKALHLVSGSNVPMAFFSLVMFVLVLIALAVGYLYRFRPEVLRQERLLYLLGVTTIIAAGVGKLCALNPNLAYLAPVTFASIIWVLLLDGQVALMMTSVLSLMMGVVTGFQLNFAIYTILGGSVAIFILTHRQQRSDLMRSGLFISATNAFSVLLLALLGGVFPPLRTLGLNLALAFCNGVSAAVIAIGLLPFLENLFGLTSAIRLLELANPNQPLLKQLLVEAPGSYHHSIIVGNLAEAAADQVGADSLLARVGAFYHDIGKIKRPYFFVENQITQDNPHEKLTPTLSTLIIIAHVKEGAEMARKAGLPESVVDIIEQHHGTYLVRYFYVRAAENAQSELPDTDFRYDGPKPQSKEAALVMLADAVEAAVRSIAKPTPAKIEALVTRVFKERLDDGQFDQCDLTLRDLERISKSFQKVLGGIFHTRIEYPESVLQEMEKKKGINGDTRRQPAG